jgi:hypothetical protein
LYPKGRAAGEIPFTGPSVLQVSWLMSVDLWRDVSLCEETNTTSSSKLLLSAGLRGILRISRNPEMVSDRSQTLAGQPGP